MSVSGILKCASIVFAIGLTAGCGGNASWGSFGASGGGSTGNGMAFLSHSPAAVPFAGVRHPDRGPSWASPQAKQSKALVYVGDWDTNDVLVYDFSSGKNVGKLTGADEPYGMCVDAKGNVYVANFGGGNAVEYARGGTKVVNTYNSGGEPIGCAVYKNGDVAVTSFSPAEIVVFAGGNPKKSRTYSDSDCEYAWTAGYDDKGNLYATGEGSGLAICELPAGKKKMRTVRLIGSASISFAGGTTWDGKYLALSDQESGGTYQTGIIQVTENPRTGDLTEVGSTSFSDDCYNDYVDDVNPFVVGKKNTPVNTHQGYNMVGPNLWCADAGTSKVNYWEYPKGGSPYKIIPNPPAEPYGAAVSLAP